MTTSAEVLRSREEIAAAKAQDPLALVPVVFVNISFSKNGLNALGIIEPPGSPTDPFEKGQLADAKQLGDVGTMMPDGSFDPSWELAFKLPIDGVFIVAGESWLSVNKKVSEINGIFADSTQVMKSLKATVRPEAHKAGDPTKMNILGTNIQAVGS